MNDLIDFLKFVSGVFLVVVVITVIPLYIVDRVSCAGFEDATGYKTQYSGLQCYASVDGKTVPKEYVFGEANEIRLKQGGN